MLLPNKLILVFIKYIMFQKYLCYVFFFQIRIRQFLNKFDIFGIDVMIIWNLFIIWY